MFAKSLHLVPQPSDAIPQQSAATPTPGPRRNKRPRAVSMRENTSITALISTPHNAGAIDRRWQIAVAIQLGLVTHWRMRKAIDADVKRAMRYVKYRERDGAPSIGELADIHCAWTLRYQAKLLARSILEARLLAGQSIAETAVACSLPVGVVRVYESLFFAVHDKLQHRVHILQQAIGPRYWTGYTAADIDILLKSMAYLRGPLFLDYVLPYFTTPWFIPDRLDNLTIAELTMLQKMISIRAMIEARTMSMPDGVQAYVRLAAGEAGTHWAALAQELQAVIDRAASASADQKRLISTVTSLSPASIRGLVDSFHPAPATAKAQDSLRMVG